MGERKAHGKKSDSSGHAKVFTGSMREEGWMVAYYKDLQKRVHVCRAPNCANSYETKEDLLGHQKSAHSAWPKDNKEPRQPIVEDLVELRAALQAVEREFTVIVQDDVNEQMSDTNLKELAKQRLNELQDAYASRNLPTAEAMCTGAVLYETLLRGELVGNDIGRLNGQFRGAIASLQHAQGLGGELENAYRSLLFRSALMDDAELRKLADNEPEDQFCLAARSALGRDLEESAFPRSTGAVGELMQVMLNVSLSRNASPEGPETTGASLLQSRAQVPWVKCLLDRLQTVRKTND